MIWPLYIIIHHSFTEDSGTVSWEAIRRYHTKTLGWNDIGYHRGVELVGDTYKVMKGRELNEEGAHCKEHGMNYKSVGVCVVGNFDTSYVPRKQWICTVDLVAELCDLLNIPTGQIRGHRDFSPKTCPGRLFDLGLFKENVRYKLEERRIENELERIHLI